jgi:hypothetical protein
MTLQAQEGPPAPATAPPKSSNRKEPRKAKKNRSRKGRTRTPSPPPSSSDSSSSSSSSSEDKASGRSHPSGNRHRGPWYALVFGKGDSHGVFQDKQTAKALSTERSITKKFQEEAPAWEWVRYHNHRSSAASEVLPTPLVVAPVPLPTVTVTPSPVVPDLTSSLRSGPTSPPLFLTGKDKSTKSEDEVYGINLDVETAELRRQLLPPGIAENSARECVECLLDAVSLPGKIGQNTEAEDSAANLQLQLEELNRTARQELGETVRHDLKWQNYTRNSLRNAKSESELKIMIDDVSGLRDRTLSNLQSAQRTILGKEAWDPLMVEAWSQGGYISTLSRKSLDFYLSLLQHISSVASKYSWKMAEMEIDFYVRKWQFIRAHAASRALALCRIYVSLRDGSAMEWLAPKLEAQKVVQLYKQVQVLETGPARAAPAPRVDNNLVLCHRCKTILHGATDCPWHNLNNTRAIKAGREALRKLGGAVPGLGGANQEE